jgi:transcriptional antiterminator NusG
MWYVIQTMTGKEQAIKIIIEKSISHDHYSECKIIYSETKRKYEGEWHTEKKTTFPGYLFIISDEKQIEGLFLQLKTIKELTKVLRTGHEIVPVSEKEERLLKQLIGETETVGMSYGYKEGDKVVITDGCLVGKEYLIRKIDRHKKKAWLEIEILGGKKVIECGLELITKVPETKRKASDANRESPDEKRGTPDGKRTSAGEKYGEKQKQKAVILHRDKGREHTKGKR